MTARQLAALMLSGLLLAAAPASAGVPYSPTVKAIINGVTQAQLKPVVDALNGEAPAIIGGVSYTRTVRQKHGNLSGPRKRGRQRSLTATS